MRCLGSVFTGTNKTAQTSHWIWSKNLGFDIFLDPVGHFGLSRWCGVASSAGLQAVRRYRRWASASGTARLVFFTVLTMCNRACYQSEISLIFFGTCISSWVFLYRVFKKQGLCRIRTLQQCTNWKVHLRICKLSKDLNKENWSFQLVWLADPFIWSV